MTHLHELARLKYPDGFHSEAFKKVLGGLYVDDFLLLDRNNNTVLHNSVASGGIICLPKEFLTRDNLLLQNEFGDSVLSKLLEYGHAGVIPEESWNTIGATTVCSMKNGKTPAHSYTVITAAAKFGQLKQLPSHYLTLENLTDDAFDRYSTLHIAASYGHLDQLPSGLLNAEALLFHSHTGHSVLEEAVVNGNCYQIRGLITGDMLTKPCTDGNTVLHLLAASKSLDYIDAELVDPAMCAKKNNSGNSVFVVALHNGSLGSIPKHCLTWEALTSGNLLEKVVRAEQTDVLLGSRFPDRARALLGDAWWERNNAVLADMDKLALQDQATDIDIF